MTTIYELRVADASGNRLATVANFIETENAALDYILSVGKIGVLTVTVPATIDPTLFPLDARMSVWRSINGAPPVQDGQAVYLARVWEYGTDYTTITGFHVNELFARRIVAYGTWRAEGNQAAAPADDLIKTLINQNMLSGTGGGFRYGDPTQVDISALLSIAGNYGQGVSAPKMASWRPLMDTILEVAEASTFSGTYIAAEVVAPTESTLEARTYAGQRGVDHGSTSSSPIVFSEARGNLKNAKLTIDRSQEVTWALARGSGTGVVVQTASALDSTRIAESPFNRREALVDVTNISDPNQLQAEANAAVRAGRPIRTLQADLVETPATTRGIQFDLGDIVTIEHRGLTIDMRLDLIHEVLNSKERKSEIKLRSTI